MSEMYRNNVMIIEILKYTMQYRNVQLNNEMLIETLKYSFYN